MEESRIQKKKVISVCLMIMLSMIFIISKKVYATGNEIILDNLAGETTLNDGDILTGTLTGDVEIKVRNGATVTLRNADLTVAKTGHAGINCLGDAVIILEGNNYVNGADYYPGVYINQYYTLTINGSGTLESTGGRYASGIGGGKSSYGFIEAGCGNICIQNGTIKATGGDCGAGIGSGNGDSSQQYHSPCGTIVINGGDVTATGGGNSANGGAGIGCGVRGTCGTITINGGKVKAVGKGIGAGIGSNSYSSCSDIIINGGNVEATGDTSYKDGAAGIGTGYCSLSSNVSTCGAISILGGTVKATGGKWGPAIGVAAAQYNTGCKCGKITIGGSALNLTAIKGSSSLYCIGVGNLHHDFQEGVWVDGKRGMIEESPYTYSSPTSIPEQTPPVTPPSSSEPEKTVKPESAPAPDPEPETPVYSGKTAKKIKFKKSSIKINDNVPTQLVLKTVEPADADVFWKSNKEDVASVDAFGVVTGHVSGKAKITAYGINGKVKATCTVTVQGPKPVKSLKLSKSSLKLSPGAFKEIKATTNPKDARIGTDITWSVDKTDVVSITPNGSSVIINALSPGKATVTAKSGNGKTKKCKITIK